MDMFLLLIYVVFFMAFIFICIPVCEILIRTKKRSPAATQSQRRANRGNQRPSGAKITNRPSGTGNYRKNYAYGNRYNYGPNNWDTTYTVVDEGPTLTNLTEANELLAELRENLDRTVEKKCCNGDGDCCNGGNARGGFESGSGYAEDRNDGDVGGGGGGDTYDSGDTGGAGDTYDGGDTGGGDDGNAD